MVSYGFNLQGRIGLSFPVNFLASGLGVFLNSTLFKERQCNHLANVLSSQRQNFQQRY